MNFDYMNKILENDDEIDFIFDQIQSNIINVIVHEYNCVTFIAKNSNNIIFFNQIRMKFLFFSCNTFSWIRFHCFVIWCSMHFVHNTWFAFIVLKIDFFEFETFEIVDEIHCCEFFDIAKIEMFKSTISLISKNKSFRKSCSNDKFLHIENIWIFFFDVYRSWKFYRHFRQWF